ncbi:MAG: roadblock/LC7 domain-containing protein [Nitrospinae bacterium]|nr:roadblock/LC7 domain-containing protein [Nitrospinota bacterium]
MDKTEERQNPSTYLKLAQTFLSLGDDDLARLTCERGLKHFPTDASLHTQRGSTLISSYNKSKKTEDLIQAIKSFEKSIAINPDNYLALMLSAKIYIKVKAYFKARQKLTMILSSFPGDPKATELLKLISAKEQHLKLVDEEKLQVELEGDDDDIDSQEDQISANYDLLASYLNLFKEEYGIEMVLLVDKYGMVIKSINMSKRDSNRYGIAVSNIFRSSQNAVRKTSLSTFSKGFLITPEYNIYIVDVKGTILVIVTLPKAENEGIEKRIEHYVREIDSKWTSKKS